MVAEACRCRRRRAHQERTQTKEEMPKRTEEKEKFLQKLALAVVPLNPAVVPLQSNLLEFDSILGNLGSKISSNPWEIGKIKASERKQRWRGS